MLSTSTPSDIVATTLSNIQSKTATRVYSHCDVTARARPTDALPRSTYLPDSQLWAHAQSWHARQLTRPLAIAARALQLTRPTARALYLSSPPRDLFTRTARERVLPNNDVIARAHCWKFDTIASAQIGHSPEHFNWFLFVLFKFEFFIVYRTRQISKRSNSPYFKAFCVLSVHCVLYHTRGSRRVDARTIAFDFSMHLCLFV